MVEEGGGDGVVFAASLELNDEPNLLLSLLLDVAPKMIGSISITE